MTNRPGRSRLSGPERREQLLNIGRAVFAERGYEAASIEDIAARAKVSKPIVYEHFGGKQGLYEAVVDREIDAVLERVGSELEAGHPRDMLEQATSALLGYIEEHPDGFRILIRDSPLASRSGSYSNLLGDIAARAEVVLRRELRRLGLNHRLAPLYAHALVGMLASVGQWWLDVRRPGRAAVASALVDLAWDGLRNLGVSGRHEGVRLGGR